MTVNTARRPRRRTTGIAPEPLAVAPVGALAIGEIGQTVFDCPSCSRPLAMGARRCPGCRTRLVLGVPVSKVSVFASTGLAIGLVVGSVGGVLFAASRLIPLATNPPIAVPGASAPAVGASLAPTALPAVSAIPAPVASAVPEPAMPALARSALTQAISLDDRILTSGTALRSALAASSFSASDVAEVLRAISADAVYGSQLADRVSSWPDAATVSDDLRAVYEAIHDRATAGLVASVRDESAYRTTARAMLVLIGRVVAPDGRARDLLTTNGVSLPDSSATP